MRPTLTIRARSWQANITSRMPCETVGRTADRVAVPAARMCIACKGGPPPRLHLATRLRNTGLNRSTYGAPGLSSGPLIASTDRTPGNHSAIRAPSMCAAHTRSAGASTKSVTLTCGI